MPKIEAKRKKIKILLAAAEIAPFAKAGGLADVIGSLPPALEKLGCDTRLIMPLYGMIKRRKFGLKKIASDIAVLSAGRVRKINLWQSKLPLASVPVYFVEYQPYFHFSRIYTKKKNAERFLFFSLACLYVMPYFNFKPDIIHCHDFHTALIPDLLKAQRIKYYQNSKTVFTIHNLNYQGLAETEVLSTGGLSPNSLKSLSRDARNGDINFMVQGILNADLITTVSPAYAREITTHTYGAKLEKIIIKRKKDLYGIVNGIDASSFDPTTDNTIKQKFSSKTLTKKINNKLYLQKKLGWTPDRNTALIGLVSRLRWQKGLELITEESANLNCQFVFLGTGSKKYETQLKKLAQKYPNKINARIMFDLELARQIYAGADIFLMPSRFEPCGLGQMIAMRYGTVPVVRATGGLIDTVDETTGFLFKKFSPNSLFLTLKKALAVYYKHPQIWRQLQINGMKKDFSWNKSARKYLKLYKKLL